jgi:hypothetical protein
VTFCFGSDLVFNPNLQHTHSAAVPVIAEISEYLSQFLLLLITHSAPGDTKKQQNSRAVEQQRCIRARLLP